MSGGSGEGTPVDVNQPVGYCTVEQLIERCGLSILIQLTNRDTPGAEEINTIVLDGAVVDATAEINMHLAGRYALPLSTIPLPIVRIACVLVRDILAGNSDSSDERWQKQAEDARKMLRDIGAGRMSLGVDALAATAAPESGVAIESGGRVWDRDGSKGFI
jgi:phage gp36-like protein